MLTKDQTLNLSGMLATASITAVGLAIGGTFGATILAGVGINLWSSIIHGGAKELKDKWLDRSEGILNHDIQQALVRAYVNALTYLEAEYFKLGAANSLPQNDKEAIRSLFKELRSQASEAFLFSSEKAVTEQEVKDYLYGKPEQATSKLLERIEGDALLQTYGEHFRDFLRKNLLTQLQIWFAEELKSDNRECNKAWRAFQRMLLEGIQADVKAVKAGQEAIRQDLQKLDDLRTRLDELKDTIDRRLPNEPFQQGLEKAIAEMQALLQDVAETTRRTEAMVVAVADELGVLPEEDIPKIPDDIRKLLDEGWALRDLGKYEDARRVFQQSLELAMRSENNLAAAKAKYGLAVILNEWDKNPTAADSLLQVCLQEFRTAHSGKGTAAVLHQLGIIEIDRGNLDQAEAYLSQALEIDRKHKRKQDIAHTLQTLGWVEDLSFPPKFGPLVK